MRLHHVYYLLATFDLVALSLSLGLIIWLANGSARSLEQHEHWSQLLEGCWKLNRLAADVNAPGNAAFKEENQARLPRWIDTQRKRLEGAYGAFMTAADDVERVLRQDRPEAPHAPEFTTYVDEIRAATQDMKAEAEEIFRRLEGDRVAAGRFMARMDESYAEVTGHLADLNRELLEIQFGLIEEQSDNAHAARLFEFLVAGLILGMVVAVVVYGHKLAGKMKESSQQLARYGDHLEALVEARTAELEASHEQLRLAERLASIGTLAAGLGHDMNNVLFPVRCRLDALESSPVDDRARDELSAVRRSVEYLQQLADGLRMLALDPDDPHASHGSTGLAAWWEAVGPMIRTALPRTAALDVEIGEGLPPVAVAPHALTQAVFNLCVNAGEVIDDRGAVRIVAEPGDGPRVRLSVSDDGPGMTDDVRRQALDPFFTTKTRGLSTGLGLALVHGVAKAAGGTVDIETAPGAGTTVILTLPAAGEEPATIDAGDGRRATVSIEDARIASFVSTLLESVGYEVHRSMPDDLDDVSVWVTDPDPGVLEMARRFADPGNGRRIIVYGGTPAELEGWERLGPVTIEAAGGLAAIQRAIRSVAGGHEP